MGAPEGNQNARKGKWGEAVFAAAQVEDPITRRRRLVTIAEKLVTLAESGDLGAIKEFGDRIDGKVAQTVALGGDPDGVPLQTQVIVNFPKP